MSTVAQLVNHQIRLAARPIGLPKDSDWSHTSEPVAEPDNGGVLYGLTAHTLGSWIYTDGSGKHTYKPAPGETGDEVINQALIVRIM